MTSYEDMIPLTSGTFTIVVWHGRETYAAKSELESDSKLETFYMEAGLPIDHYLHTDGTAWKDVKNLRTQSCNNLLGKLPIEMCMIFNNHLFNMI